MAISGTKSMRAKCLADWTTGYIPLRKTRPFEQPPTPLDGQMYALNADLANWA